LAVRVQVAERQARILRIAYSDSMFDSDGARLAYLLRQLFNDKPFALDHNPALMNRKRRGTGKNTIYSPPANDPDHLIYRDAGPGSDHDIKTRVRGDGAQHSDLALARIAKRRAKKLARLKRDPVAFAEKATGRKMMPFQKKALRSISRWPKGRKIQSRGFQPRAQNTDEGRG